MFEGNVPLLPIKPQRALSRTDSGNGKDNPGGNPCLWCYATMSGFMGKSFVRQVIEEESLFPEAIFDRLYYHILAVWGTGAGT